MSPCSHRFGFKESLFTTISLSEMLPGYVLEMNLKAPPGAVPQDFEILGWCPAGPVLPHGENVPL